MNSFIKGRLERLIGAFQRKTRTNGETYYCIASDRQEQWMQDLMMEAHDGMLPDDFRYEMIHDALLALDDDWEDPYLESNQSNYKLATWLGSHGARADYCDNSVEDIPERLSVFSIIEAGYRTEQNEILNILKDRLTELANEQSEGDEDGEIVID